MKNLTDEIKLTIELMQGDIDDGAHGELQSHLYSLLEMKRGLLSERVHTYTPAQIQIWPTDADDVKCKVMSFKGYGRVPKLLTCEDLKLGGWFCRDVGNRSAVAFVEHGFDVCLFHEWGRSHESYAGCVLNLEDRKVTRVYTISDSCFEIVRFGNQFYRV